jgi:MFS family permease
MGRSRSAVAQDASTRPGATLLSLTPSAFLPAIVYEIGNGAIAPIIALTALDLHGSASTAGFMLAFLGIGQVLGDIPASALADRVGDRRAMILAAGLAILALAACLLAPALPVLGAGLLALGASNATFYLARQSYLSDVVPASMRARAMSTLGGSHRVGLFLGPFLGAAAIAVAGMRAAYVVAIVAVACAALLLAVVPDLPAPPGQPKGVRGTVTSRQIVSIYRTLFSTLGVAVFLVGAVRAARQTVLPLWAEHLGLSPASTSVVFGIANAVDMALFYPAGKIMDQLGRIAVALPSMTILGLSMMALPLTHAPWTLTAVAMVMSFGNGVGSGIMMTLGADAAPVDGRIRFLGIWRVLSDSGNAAGPLVVSAVAAVSSLAIGIVAIGSTGLLAAAGLRAWVPRYSPFATRADVRAHAQSQAPAQPHGRAQTAKP